MMGGFIQTEHKKSDIKTYVADLLTLGHISLFLPVSFIFSEDMVIAEHKTGDFRPLHSAGELSAQEGMELLASFIKGTADAGRHYIYDKDYEADPGRIYTDRAHTEVKLCFIPAPDKSGKPGAEKLIMFSRLIKEKMTGEGRGYIKKAEEFIVRDDPGPGRLLRYVRGLNREIYLCGIK